MLTFNPQYYPYSSRRSVVYAANGMCCAGNPTVTSIGLQTMLKGGNAIDAAVAMAAAQPVVEPAASRKTWNLRRSMLKTVTRFRP